MSVAARCAVCVLSVSSAVFLSACHRPDSPKAEVTVKIQAENWEREDKSPRFDSDYKSYYATFTPEMTTLFICRDDADARSEKWLFSIGIAAQPPGPNALHYVFRSKVPWAIEMDRSKFVLQDASTRQEFVPPRLLEPGVYDLIAQRK